MNLLEQWIEKNDKFDDMTMNRLQEDDRHSVLGG